MKFHNIDKIFNTVYYFFMENPIIQFGIRFKELRKSLDLDQRALGDMLRLSVSSVSAIESGRLNKMDDEAFIVACLRVFDCDRDTLLGNTEPPQLQNSRLKQFSESLLRSALKGKTPVFIMGDLCHDTVVVAEKPGVPSKIVDNLVGGQGYHFANALASVEKSGYFPVLFGAVGSDPYGDFILRGLRDANIPSLVLAAREKRTGKCNISFNGEIRTITYNNDPNEDIEHNDSNNFSAAELRTALKLSGLNKDDGWIIVISPAVFPRYKILNQKNVAGYEQKFVDYIDNIMGILRQTGVPLIMKIPHTFKELDKDEFNLIMQEADLLYTELETLCPFYDNKDKVSKQNIETILGKTKGKLGQEILVLFDGYSNIGNVRKYKRTGEATFEQQNKIDYIKSKEAGEYVTGYKADLPPNRKAGFISYEYIDKFIDELKERFYREEK